MLADVGGVKEKWEKRKWKGIKKKEIDWQRLVKVVQLKVGVILSDFLKTSLGTSGCVICQSEKVGAKPKVGGKEGMMGEGVGCLWRTEDREGDELYFGKIFIQNIKADKSLGVS